MLLLVFVATASLAQQRKFGLYPVAFYNLENIFDTVHDEGKNDYDFLPNGSYHWDKNKYENKLKNMARALLDLGTDKVPNGAAVIGVSEVENSRVLDDLTSQPGMLKRGMKYVHIEGPDKRGVDCALLYNPRIFHVDKYFLQPYVHDPGDNSRPTRGFLTVQGRMDGDKLTVIVCHWPSRAATVHYRSLAGKQVRHLTDSISKADPEQRIIVMGDLNDDPDDPSVARFLGGRRKISGVREGDFFNPWWEMLRGKGQGTLSYQGGWNLFDQILMSRNLLDIDGKKDYRHLKLYTWHIFKRDYLIQQEGKYKGSPKRTTAGGVWLNGYSDHLPTVVYLIKETK